MLSSRAVSEEKKLHIIQYSAVLLFALVVAAAAYAANTISLGAVSYSQFNEVEEATKEPEVLSETVEEPVVPVWPAPLDIAEYNARLLALTNYTPPPPVISTTSREDGTVATTTTVVSDLISASSTNVTVKGSRWPTLAPYPYGDAILPFKRILAYYGNFYSTKMGILGEYDPEVVIQHLASTTELWEAADPATPVLPAIEYIAMVAQAGAGADGMYRAVMPEAEIEKGYDLAKQINGIYILDLQVGLSTIERELPKFKKYLDRPEVHLAIDPEFSMKYGDKPGTVIGTFDASDVNYVIKYMSDIVKENHLPPKVLIVHRFTQDMITHASQINPTPEVQVIINMDGWGSKDLKRGTYTRVIEPEPVQFTGVKIFYKNDLKPPSTGLLSPQEVLNLDPKPIYIQYQ